MGLPGGSMPGGVGPLMQTDGQPRRMWHPGLRKPRCIAVNDWVSPPRRCIRRDGHRNLHVDIEGDTWV